MTESPENNQNSNSTSNSETPTQTPPANPTPAQTPAPTQPVPNFSEVVNAINAIPEKVAHAVREMNPAPPQPREQPKAEQREKEAPKEPKKEPEPATTTTKPGSKTFAEWWFTG